MKVVLTAVNAKYIHSNLAVYSLAGYSAQHDHNVKIREFTINQTVDYAIEEIYKEQPDILCFSCYIWNIMFVEQLMHELHKLLPRVPIWVGGPEVSYEVEAFLRTHPEVTGVMIGEGEATFAEVLDVYEKTQDAMDETRVDRTKTDEDGAELQQVRGIGYLDNDVYIETRIREPMNMDDIPFAYHNMEDFKHRIVYYESSRGCPFRCSYCLSSVEKSLRFRSISLVEKELQFFIDNQVPQVKFVDRTFNCDHEHAMAIWKFIKEADQGITNFHFEISADLLWDEEIAFLNTLRPGLIQLEIGVQSTNEDTIHEIRRTMDLGRLKETTKAVQQGYNIHQHLDLIAGLPYENINSFARSFDEVYAMKPNQLQMGFLKVLKGSYMYEHRQEYELVYKSTPQYEVMATKWLSFGDVIRLKQIEEMLEVYYNSGQFEVTIKVLETAVDSPFALYDALGKYYESHGYFLMKYNRNQRAQILLEFVKESRILCDTKLMAEALTYDIYYRENAKSRPAFAGKYLVPKEVRRRYEGKGKLQHVETFTYRFPDKACRTLDTLPQQVKPYYVLFDYEYRDSLDHQAQVTIIQEEADE